MSPLVLAGALASLRMLRCARRGGRSAAAAAFDLGPSV